MRYVLAIVSLIALALLASVVQAQDLVVRTAQQTVRAAVSPNDTSTTVDGQSLYSQEAEILRITNVERVGHGLQPLVLDMALVEQARDHNWMMATTTAFHHSGQGAEKIIMGYGDAQASMAGWMRSPGHRANILNPGYRYIGISIYDAGHGIYATQRFR